MSYKSNRLHSSQRIPKKKSQKISKNLKGFFSNTFFSIRPKKNLKKSEKISKNLRIHFLVLEFGKKNLKKSQKISKNLKKSQEISRKSSNISKNLRPKPRKNLKKSQTKAQKNLKKSQTKAQKKSPRISDQTPEQISKFTNIKETTASNMCEFV